MAWTTPRTWVNGEVPGETIFNAHVRDNLNYLYSGRPNSAVVRDNGATYTTSSGTFVDIDGTNLAITLSITSGKVLIFFTGVTQMAAASEQPEFDITVDGTRIGAAGNDGLVTVQAGTSTHKIPFCIAVLKTDLSSGSHTFKPVWRAVLGTVKLFSGNGVSTEDTLPTFGVTEVG